MKTEQLGSIGDLERFADGSQKAAFAVLGEKGAKYAWVQSVLIKHRYMEMKKPEKSIVIRYNKK